MPVFTGTIHNNDGEHIYIPIPAGQKVTATLVQDGDSDLIVLLDGRELTESARAGQGASEYVTDLVTETAGNYEFYIRRYGNDAPVGSNYKLTVGWEAAPVYVPVKRALAIGLAEEWAAKLRGIHDEQGGQTISNAIGVYATFKYDIGATDMSRFDLVIIGHNETRWNDDGDKDRIQRLLTMPLLLQGRGGQRFAEQAGLIQRGVIWSGDSQRASSYNTILPVWHGPYPLDWDLDILVYQNFAIAYGISGSVSGVYDLMVTDEDAGMDTIFRLNSKPVYYFGYPTIPDAWELWGLWCNIAWSLAVQK